MKENDNRGGGQGKIARITESKSYQYIYILYSISIGNIYKRDKRNL